jgi:hypothetical protein
VVAFSVGRGLEPNKDYIWRRTIKGYTLSKASKFVYWDEAKIVSGKLIGFRRKNE